MRGWDDKRCSSHVSALEYRKNCLDMLNCAEKYHVNAYALPRRPNSAQKVNELMKYEWQSTLNIETDTEIIFDSLVSNNRRPARSKMMVMSPKVNRIR